MEHTLDVSNNQESAAAESAVPENLVAWVNALLAEKGHPAPQAWMRLLKPGIDGLPDSYQAFEINRAWRTALAETIGTNLLTTEESMNVRYALIDRCPIENWKQAFTAGALPCILRHQLPIQK
jgi:hypothetical protein